MIFIKFHRRPKFMNILLSLLEAIVHVFINFQINLRSFDILIKSRKIPGYSDRVSVIRYFEYEVEQ